MRSGGSRSFHANHHDGHYGQNRRVLAGFRDGQVQTGRGGCQVGDGLERPPSYPFGALLAKLTPRRTSGEAENGRKTGRKTGAENGTGANAMNLRRNQCLLKKL